MLLAHAVDLADARSYVAALADRAQAFEASVEYERVLLHLDRIHGDDIPGIDPVPAAEREALHAGAEAAIGKLPAHGVDALEVELVLDMLKAARGQDVP